MIRVILDTPYGLLLILSALISSVHGTCPSSPGGCINETLFNQLSPGDPNYYCEEGAKLVATAQNCLRDCKFAEEQSLLVKWKTSINKACAQIDTDCPNVCDTLVEQTRCYDKYKGLDAVITKIVTHFEAGLPLDCNEFSWGRYCQTTRNCSINKNLDNYLIKSNKIIGLGLAICGTEKLKSILPYLDEGDGCKLDIESSIINKCNISCPLANAESSTEICIQLETQAKCLQEQTAGCTDAKRLYALPRLNTYAIANKYLECAIKFDGVKVQTSGRVIQYSDLINACMLPYPSIVESTLTPSNYGLLKQLFNFDTLVVNFCASKGEQKEKIKDCKNAFLGSLTPQAKLLIRAEDEYASDNIKFLPKIGGFPVDHCGMAYIYNWLPEVCPKSLQWTSRLCVPSSDSTNNGPKSTETPAGIGNGEEHHTKGTKADDYIKNSTGDMLPSVAVLAFTCLLGFAVM